MPTYLDVAPPKPLVVPSTTSVLSTHGNTLRIGASEGLASRRAVQGNEMGVTFQWAPAAGAGGGSMRVLLLQGMALLTVQYDGLTPSIDQFSTILAANRGTFNGTRFKVGAGGLLAAGKGEWASSFSTCCTAAGC